MPHRVQAELAQSLISCVSSAMAQARSSSMMSRQVLTEKGGPPPLLKRPSFSQRSDFVQNLVGSAVEAGGRFSDAGGLGNNYRAHRAVHAVVSDLIDEVSEAELPKTVVRREPVAL